MVSPVAALRCRQIEAADIGAVASLLARGFPVHDREFWLKAFAQLSRHEPPAGLPKYGYLLAMGDAVVGALSLICSTMRTGGTIATALQSVELVCRARISRVCPDAGRASHPA